MPNVFLGTLRCTPATVAPGQAVLVEALTLGGQAVGADLDVVINGVKGAKQYLQWDKPGEFQINAVAKTSGAWEVVTAKVQVEERWWPRAGDLKTVTAAVARYPLLRVYSISCAVSPYHLHFNARDNSGFSANLEQWFSSSEVGVNLASAVDTAIQIAHYEWDFGDGTPLVTTSGADVAHDFESALAPEDLHRVFHVRCTATTAGGDKFEVLRSLSITHAYGLSRALGVVVPTVVAMTRAHHVQRHLVASLQVLNREATPITLERRQFYYDLGEQAVTTPVETIAPIVLRPGVATNITVWVPYETVLPSAHSFTVAFFGTAPQGQRVHVEALVDFESGFAPGLILGDEVTALGNVNRNVDDILHGDPKPDDDRVGRLQQVANELSRLGAPPAVVRALQMPTSVEEPSIPPGDSPESERLRLLRIDRQHGATGVDKDGLPRVIPRGRGGSGHGGFSPVGRSLDRPSWGHPTPDITWPIEGDECDPDNLPGDLPRGWSARPRMGSDGQLVSAPWHYAGRYANARTGYLILAPGSTDGQVGGMLRHLSHPQKYGHTGIMTRNHDMITHSTFSQERLKDYPVGATAAIAGVDVTSVLEGIGVPLSDVAVFGHAPQVVKYGWPGVVTQWVEDAVDQDQERASKGQLVDLPKLRAAGLAPGAAVTDFAIPAADPVNNKSYKIQMFNRFSQISFDPHTQSWEVVPPMVIMPPPEEETADVRARLNALASAALDDTGKSHYRFYCYTNPSQDDHAPVDLPGLAGSYPSVCSSFIWGLMRRLGFPMKGKGGQVFPADLTAQDQEAGLEVLPSGSPDGLFLYRAADRRVAAQFLFDTTADDVRATVLKMVHEKNHWNDDLDAIKASIYESATGIAEHIANQLANTFAVDDASTEHVRDSLWQGVEDAYLVSPDNIMHWSPPSRGGLYGHVVPAVYLMQSTETRPVFEYHFTQFEGPVEVSVLIDGKPAASVPRLAVNGIPADPVTRTGPASFRLPAVEFGPYYIDVEAYTSDGVLVPGCFTGKLDVGTPALELNLAVPSNWFRTIRVEWTMSFCKHYVVGHDAFGKVSDAFEVAVAPLRSGSDVEPQSLEYTFHGINGLAMFRFHWEPNGVVQFGVKFAASTKADFFECVGVAASDFGEWLSLGFAPNLFANEFSGGDSWSGSLRPGNPTDAGQSHDFDDPNKFGPGNVTRARFSCTLRNIAAKR